VWIGERGGKLPYFEEKMRKFGPLLFSCRVSFYFEKIWQPDLAKFWHRDRDLFSKFFCQTRLFKAIDILENVLDFNEINFIVTFVPFVVLNSDLTR
jgi:hypothetical protein